MPPVETRFTHANAREMAARSVAARKAAELEAIADPLSAADDRKEPQAPHARECARLKKQMGRLDDLLDAAQTAADWRDLTNARARLFDQWAHLAGIPKPGSRRPGREVTRRVAPPAEPTPAEPGPSGTPPVV